LVRVLPALACLLVSTTSCGREERPARDEAAAPSALGAPPVPAGCRSPGTDSARAVCTALGAMAAQGMPSRPFEVTRRGDVFCVITIPASPAVLDGMGGVLVRADGEVLDPFMADSAYCRWSRIDGSQGPR
jgi:hypothetical protein